MRIESVIEAIEREREKLAAMLEKQSLSDERIKRIMAFAEKQADKVELASRDFATRRALIDELDVRASLVWENKEPAIYAQCVLGEERLVPGPPLRI